MIQIKLKKLVNLFLLLALIFGTCVEGCLYLGLVDQGPASMLAMGSQSSTLAMSPHNSMQMNSHATMPMQGSASHSNSESNSAPTMLCCDLSVDQNMPALPFQLFGPTGMAGFVIALFALLFLAPRTTQRILSIFTENPPHSRFSPITEHIRSNR